MNVSSTSSAQATFFGSSGRTLNANGQQTSSLADALADFKAEASKTPAQRAKDEILKKHNMTEADYNKLADGQRKTIDQEIQVAQRRALTGTAAASTNPGSFAQMMDRFA